MLRLPTNCRTVVSALGDRSKKIREQVCLLFRCGETEFQHACVVVSKLVEEVILRCDWLSDSSVSINFEQAKLVAQVGGLKDRK